MLEKDDNEVQVRIAARDFAMELSDDEVRFVSGGDCSGTDTVNTGAGSPGPDKSLDCSF